MNCRPFLSSFNHTCNYSELKSSSYTNITVTSDNMLTSHTILMNKLLWIQLYCDFSGMMGNLTERFREHSLIFVEGLRSDRLCVKRACLCALRLDSIRSCRMNAALYVPAEEWRAQLSSRALTSCSSSECKQTNWFSVLSAHDQRRLKKLNQPVSSCIRSSSIKPVWQQRIIGDVMQFFRMFGTFQHELCCKRVRVCNWLLMNFSLMKIP